MSRATIFITGASGGLGASTLAAALARAISESGCPTVLLDLDREGGGIDVTCGIEHEDGLRWPDFAGVQGEIDPVRLLDALPGPRDCKVLSAAPGRSAARELPQSNPHAEGELIASLNRTGRAIVVDLPRHAWSAARLRPTLWLFLVRSDSRGLADLDALLGQIDGVGKRRADGFLLATVGASPRADLAEAITLHTGLPVIGHVGTRRAVRQAAERGEWPGGKTFSEVVKQVAHRLPEVRRAA